MHTVRPGDRIAILGKNEDTGRREEWFARVEKFIKVGEINGKRMWDFVIVRYFEDFSVNDWPKDINLPESDCRILKWHGSGKKTFFVTTEHVICRVDISSILQSKGKSELFIYNP